MNTGKLIFTRNKNQIWSYLLGSEGPVEINVFDEKGTVLGSVYTAKVSNVVPNIGAAFVEIANRQTCFLSLQPGKSLWRLNRPWDGQLKAGDEIVVQLVREPLKTKEAAVSGEISFTGRFCVLTMDGGGIHYSNKFSEKEKSKLQNWIKETDLKKELPEGNSLILRTNCSSLTDPEPLLKEARQFIQTVLRLKITAPTRTARSLLWEAPSPWLLELRDTYGDQYSEILTDDQSLYDELSSFLKASADSLEKKKLSLYDDERVSLSALYNLERRKAEALDKNVWLKSGGYLVIEPTEALTVIDVNTGKNIKKKSSEETYYQTNREAALEIARQLRLRNLSGIIIVDFINMSKKEQKEDIINLLSELVKRDSVRTKVMGITSLGLVEITRKKIRRPLSEQIRKDV